MQGAGYQHQKSACAHEIYPAFCFQASPTYNKWVKLTAADVHGLRSHPGFEGITSAAFVMGEDL